MEVLLKDVIKDFLGKEYLRKNAKHKIECKDINKVLDENFVEVKITETHPVSNDGSAGCIYRYKLNKYEFMIGKVEHLCNLKSIAYKEYLRLCGEYRELNNNALLDKILPFEEFLQKKLEEYKKDYEFVDTYTFIDTFPISKYLDVKNLSQLKQLNRKKFRELEGIALRDYHKNMIEKYGVEYAIEAKKYFENKLIETNNNKLIALSSTKSPKNKEVVNAKYIVKESNIKFVIDNLNKNIEKLSPTKIDANKKQKTNEYVK